MNLTEAKQAALESARGAFGLAERLHGQANVSEREARELERVARQLMGASLELVARVEGQPEAVKG